MDVSSSRPKRPDLKPLTCWYAEEIRSMNRARRLRAQQPAPIQAIIELVLAQMGGAK